MPLKAGTLLGSHEILALLGQGGMGEVYRARDTKLKRDVALKILPDAFSCDLDLVSRFQREAEVLASLNHSNIAAIYDFQESNGIRFLILELVEGDTLAERIGRGALPADEALRVAEQICEALEAAHEKGIIHRDLKPANVKITPEGKVKVLDFGLAKALENAPGNPSPSNSPTLSAAATMAGVILGTAAYMSPEQARGYSADARSDVFSFGCVLYEMLTGRPPFQGETVSDVLASVLKTEVDFSRLPTKLGSRARDLLGRCLDKNPKRRWHAAADLRREIETILADPQGLAVAERAPTALGLWKYALVSLAAAILASGITGFWYSRPSKPSGITRFPITLGMSDSLLNGRLPAIAISPDGSKVVYSANGRGFIRPMSDFEARPIPGSESGENLGNPVFSADGQFIFYFSFTDSSLKKIPITGGTPITIGQIPPPSGMSWYDDSIVFGDYVPGGSGASIRRISVKGGKVETLLRLKEGELVHGPQILPGGQAVLFTLANAGAVDRWNNARIVAQSLASNEPKVLIEGGSDARYVPTGHLVYALGGTLRAVAFDVSRLEVIGEPVPIVEGVLRAPTTASGAAHFNFSTNGSLVYVPGQPGANSNESYVGLIDRKGNLKRLNLPPGRYSSPRISPDGKRVALGADDGKEANIWTYELSGATSPKRLTFGGSNRFPIWTRNGERIAFQSDREGDRGIFWQRADGAGIAERLTKAEPKTSHLPDSWSPDGQNMSFTFERENSDGDVWILSLRDRKTAPLIQAATSFQGRSVFSPDGRWVAYQSTESGLSQIFVQPYPTTGAIYQLFKTNAVSAAPMWSPDSKNLFYVDRLPGPGRLNALGFTTNPSLVFGNPVPLAVAGLIQLPPPGNPRNYDVTPDGSQFVLIFDSTRTESETPVLEIRVVLNWFEDLKQRVPLR